MLLGGKYEKGNGKREKYFKEKEITGIVRYHDDGSKKLNACI
jgi:hypothetical protein